MFIMNKSPLGYGFDLIISEGKKALLDGACRTVPSQHRLYIYRSKVTHNATRIGQLPAFFPLILLQIRTQFSH